MSHPELSAAARAFADEDVALLPAALSAAEGEALVALLTARADAARLQRLGNGADKILAKLARKALHVLRTKGVAAPKPEVKEVRVVGPFAAAETLSLASIIDGRGERLVWLVRTADEGFDVYEAQLSESRGILAFTAAHAPKKRWRQHVAKITGDERLGIGRVSERHARGLVEVAYQRTLAAGRVPPEAFARARLGLGHYEPEDRHPAYLAAPPLPPPEALPELAALLELPELRMWIPPVEVLPELDLEVGNIVTSQLIVEPAQRRAQLEEALRKVAERTLTPEYRALLAERLLETALLLASREPAAAASPALAALAPGLAARLCTSAAALTLDAAVPAAANPLVMRLFAKVVRAPEPEEPGSEPPPEQTTPSGLVLP